jgi:PAS domain S-box-containing protein
MADIDDLVEAGRIEVIRGLGLGNGTLDAADEATRFAAALCEAPIALVSLVDSAHQFFIGNTGLGASETPREQSFCAHAMLGDDIMIVPDASVDPRFRDNPLVTGAPHIRFYAGVPLVSREGYPLGSLCVIDTEPRAEGLTPLQRQGLQIIARGVMLGLESRRGYNERKAGEIRAARALSDVEQRFRTLADAMPQMVWSTQADGFHDYYNARWYQFTGVPEGSTDGEAWNGMFHPDDQDRAWTRWRHSLETGEPYEIEYRLRHHSGEYRWTLGRALPIRDDDGNITRWFGTCTDIHEQKLLLDQREVVAHELSHRIKNIFSVINGLIGLSAREHPEMADAAVDLRERIVALGRAHDVGKVRARGVPCEEGQGDLRSLLDTLLAPYKSRHVDRVAIIGPDVPVDERATTPIALLCHEFATNAAKYGALSTPEGRVTITIAREGDQCVIEWREQDGPIVTEPTQEGFGSRLIALSVERQLGGTVSRDWQPNGLLVRLSIPNQSLCRSS